ncbi:MAG: serine O-acetyltransferase [Lachnospiraceae bacterium]|nr:serine O-acetyltransferase [Lachnospiraceae bacterium]
MGLISYFKEQVKLTRDRDPAIHSALEVLVYPGVVATAYYRVAHKMYQSGHYFLSRWLSHKAYKRTGIDIHPGAQIGKGFFIDHGSGVVIGETSIIGDNCTLFQGATLGGTGKEHGKRHPTLGDNVMVSAGASVLGSITIGDNTKIGAGAVVLMDTPPNSTVVGVPGRVVRLNQERVTWEDLDQVHLPDPVQQDICRLQFEYNRLYKRVEALESQEKTLEKGEHRADLQHDDKEKGNV